MHEVCLAHRYNHVHVSDGTTDMSENSHSRTLVKINPTSVAGLKYDAYSNQVNLNVKFKHRVIHKENASASHYFTVNILSVQNCPYLKPS